MVSRTLDVGLIGLVIALAACQPPAAQTTLGRLNAPDGFEVESHEIIFYGLCDTCVANA